MARVYEQIANARQDFHFKAAHQLCDAADVIVVEDLNRVGLSRGMLSKHMLDGGYGQFLNSVLPWVGFKRGKAVVKEKAVGTSQECPGCGEAVRQTLATRWHECSCSCSMPRDIASGLVLRNRVIGGGAHRLQDAPGEDLAGGVLHSSQDSVNGESPAIHEGLAG